MDIQLLAIDMIRSYSNKLITQMVDQYLQVTVLSGRFNQSDHLATVRRRTKYTILMLNTHR